MAHDRIHEEAARVLRVCETRDPLRIARDLGIHVLFNNEFDKLKGMYKMIQQSRFIILNANLNEHMRDTVCAHEIGHDRLHRNLAKTGALKEFMLYDMQNRPEYEANVFAADILIDNGALLELVFDGRDIVEISGELEADINMVVIKLAELREQGYQIRLPFTPQANFLGNR